ncbi:hypothetical protein [Desulfofustis limnaeus]|uniref:Secreted protein n=1 Tax=Desulfofustis limnaeus TaxID=2740163 RepID=A0ABN6M5S2_9BACT|nr:hypothetical protein [Desulfofustis limnaeus]BDD88226.1 hypothetical protein DPPLL_25910 [Desulfofustis limnaeus]
MKKTISMTAVSLLASSFLFITAAGAVVWSSDERGEANYFTSSTGKTLVVADRSMSGSSVHHSFGPVIWGSDERGQANYFPASPESERNLAATDDRSTDATGQVASGPVIWGSDERGEAQLFASSSADSPKGMTSEPAAELTVAGTIRIENPAIWPSEERLAAESVILRNDRGEVFELADNKVGNDLRYLDGKSVEIKGTALEGAGRTTISVDDYNLLK